MSATEMPHRNGPFTQVRRVPWGDLDPAGSLYFAHVSRYCMEALEQWFVDRLGVNWSQLSQSGLACPCVRAELEFRRAVTAQQSLSISVGVQKIGRSSVSFRIVGRAAGEVCWDGRFTHVFADTRTGRSADIPPEFRAVLEHEAVLASDG